MLLPLPPLGLPLPTHGPVRAGKVKPWEARIHTIHSVALEAMLRPIYLSIYLSIYLAEAHSLTSESFIPLLTSGANSRNKKHTLPHKFSACFLEDIYS